MYPDTCLVSFYETNGRRLGLHQDCDESSDSLRRGLPVVSISVGTSAIFVYGRTERKRKLKSVYLDSGDVLIFGGESRHIYHGVEQVSCFTSTDRLYVESQMRLGRLSLTLRQF
ncbi:putative DNA oxidative demethylase [Helianthus annuus]|uniref:DNA oxidative demethylase n=1 Tax=Helianthus annuus TaxID=4232 RepID=A0A9K3DLV8_HELAN|nr:putative DNA oxidative demethylase [Helianthus annuus]KAF5757665.1 putative DNA oxidative demethylase [Helianthus annuus]KAJ0431014.1 putative DNA oxidative demethylase [Helianthus annuus]KAJ0431015.1 putative DNA oxidative demethylase [Helianthus annuus]KAJ0436104.1 putative DNA oxidative demethylase [Helianthus annuus]